MKSKKSKYAEFDGEILERDAVSGHFGDSLLFHGLVPASENCRIIPSLQHLALALSTSSGLSNIIRRESGAREGLEAASRTQTSLVESLCNTDYISQKWLIR
jgi:hypothetical protein